MPGLDPRFMCHQLSVKPGSKPITQKKRKQGEEKRAAVKEEVGKLLAPGFIREVQYPTWLANVVMVRKANGRWRMCTDYTDLNKACPKDPYPLPSIDRLVDGVSGQALLSFMDAYSGYNQIRMHPDDEEKTAFITEAGAFCYKVMPFGLKNAGATYQRLMDKVFKEIIGKDMEVYVDDMVVKSSRTETHFHTLEQVFAILRRNQLRLNPEKCSFGVKAGKFLGFMLTKRGIEENPDKCQAIIDMRSPRNLKEVQQLTGKMTALSRFIPRSAETALPIFGALKKGRFAWTDECEEAFQHLKATLSAPPILTRPTPGARRRTTADLLREQGITRPRDSILEDGKSRTNFGNDLPKVETILPKLLDNCEDRPTHLANLGKTQSGRTVGSLEHTVIRIQHNIRKPGTS
ncbi:hypothetical protein CR513_30207, partial [Mucuna pruriens]